MSYSNFAIDVERLATIARAFIAADLPIVIGKTAVDLFTQNFQEEGFRDGTIQKWQEVKRRINPRNQLARSSRKILTGDTGDLGRSLKYEPGVSEVKITSDVPYAQAHNEGTTTAGRGNNTTIPQRKFMGDSKDVTEAISKELDKFFSNIH